MREETRREIALIIERHIEPILDGTMEAFAAEIPSIADSERAHRTVRHATRRAILAFLSLYADPTSRTRDVLGRARRATVDRAGEEFSQDEILAMMRIARHVVFQSAREHVTRELGQDPDRAEEIAEALDVFMQDLRGAEHLLEARGTFDIHRLLLEAELEGPDFS